MVLEGNLPLHARQGQPRRALPPRSSLARPASRESPQEQAAGGTHQDCAREQRETLGHYMPA
eukprot:1801299-Pleurochrysis_carterae.AAC.1